MGVHLVDAHRGEEHVSSGDAAIFNTDLWGDGEFVFDWGNKLAASAGIEALELYVASGEVLMQGRRIRVTEHENLMFSPCDQGMKRNDLIVLRYHSTSEGIETADMAVLEGVPTLGTPTDPEFTHANLYGTASLNEMPLYRVQIVGATRGATTQLFKLFPFKVRGDLTYIKELVLATKLNASYLPPITNSMLPTLTPDKIPTLDISKISGLGQTPTGIVTLSNVFERVDPFSISGSFADCDTITSTAYKYGRIVLLNLQFRITGWGGLSGNYQCVKLKAVNLAALRPIQNLIGVLDFQNISTGVPGSFYFDTSGVLWQRRSSAMGTAPDTHYLTLMYLSA